MLIGLEYGKPENVHEVEKLITEIENLTEKEALFLWQFFDVQIHSAKEEIMEREQKKILGESTRLKTITEREHEYNSCFQQLKDSMPAMCAQQETLSPNLSPKLINLANRLVDKLVYYNIPKTSPLRKGHPSEERIRLNRNGFLQFDYNFDIVRTCLWRNLRKNF